MSSLVAILALGQDTELRETERLWRELVDADLAEQPRTKGGLRNPDNMPRTPNSIQNAPKAPAQNLSRAMVGVTVWKLRPPRPSDPNGVRVKEIVHGASQTPARLQLDSQITGRDNLVLAVSATRSGYLYIWSRERYEDGRIGPAKLIFPSSRLRGGNNRIIAGRAVRIPDSTDEPSVLTLLRKAGQRAEEVLVVVSPLPIPGVTEGAEIPVQKIAEWQKQWSSIVRQIDARDPKPMTLAEFNALAGTGDQVILPQRFYELRSSPGTNLMVAIPLSLTE